MEKQLSDILIPSINYFVERKSLPAWSLARGRIGFHDLTYILRGEAVYIVNDRPYQLKGGDLIYIPGNNIREAYTSKSNPMHCYAFNFQLTDITGKPAQLPLPTYQSISDDSSFIGLYRDFNSFWLEKNDGYMMQCTALFMLIIYNLHKIAAGHSTLPADPRLTRVRNYILSNYHKKLRVSELAAISGLNPVYFGSWFRKSTGQPVNAYINRIRINKARDLLSTGGCSVSEAAYRCGFEDPFYFSHVFKSMTGQSPSNIITTTNNFV